MGTTTKEPTIDEVIELLKKLKKFGKKYKKTPRINIMMTRGILEKFDADGIISYKDSLERYFKIEIDL